MNMKVKNKIKSIGTAYLFMLPALLLITFYMVYPAIKTVIMSFYDWDGFSSVGAEFVGIANYAKMLKMPKFWNALENNVIYTLCVVVTTVVMGMLLAIPIDRCIRGWKVFKFAFYIPTMLSVTVVGMLFKQILEPNNGLLNSLLIACGLESWAMSWLSDPDIAMWVVLAVVTWQYAGTTMLLFLAAMASIPNDVHEAATLDGVSEVSRFFKITLPIIKRPVMVVVMLQLIFGFKSYDIFAVLTKGGPGTTTQVLSLLVTQTAFKNGQYGLACAIAVVMIVIVSIISVFYIRQSKLGDQDVE